MTEDFAVLDFALVDVPALAVVEALQRARQGGYTSADVDMPEEKENTGLLSRLFGGRSDSTEMPRIDVPPYRVQPSDSLPAGPITRLVQGDMGFGSDQDPIRVSAPVGPRKLTLIEFRNHAAEQPAPLLRSLSASLPATEIYAFRYTGERHSGAEYAFAMYEDDDMVRMRSSISAQGNDEDADWRGIDQGNTTALEKHAGLPRVNLAFPQKVLTPDMQYALLQALEVEPDTLFDPDVPYEVQMILAVSETGQSVEEALENALKAKDHQPTIIRSEPAPAGPFDEIEPDIPDDWEGEITGLLVDAVEDALPPEEHVPWLNQLTAQLERGDIEGAMIKAQSLIHRGNRPEAVRNAAADRLTTLFLTRVN